MKLKYLICNLKANKTYDEMLSYKESLTKIPLNNIEFILAPSSIYLPLFKDTNINLCTQDIALCEKLNLTGDISIHQLKSLDVKYAIIGHFERRKYYKESEYEILEKIKDALENNIKVIYCIGETAEEKERKVEYQVLERQIARILNKLNPKDLKNIIIAYEPSYLIGKETTYDILKIRSMIIFIKKLIQDYYGINIEVVFGGSVNNYNIDYLTNIKDLDGFIICSSVLYPENITQIIKKMTIK